MTAAEAAPEPNGPATSKRSESGGAIRALPRPPALERSSWNSHLKRCKRCSGGSVAVTHWLTCSRLTGVVPAGTTAPGAPLQPASDRAR